MAETTPDPAVDVVAPAMPAALSMVVLSARDVPRLRRFYRDLGWEEHSGASDDLSIFDLGGVALALHRDADPARREPTRPPLPEDPAATLVVKVAGSGEVDAACTSAARAGARIVSEPVDQPWGGRSAVVADPEGNRWELLWVPGSGPSAAPGPAPGG